MRRGEGGGNKMRRMLIRFSSFLLKLKVDLIIPVHSS